MLPTFFFLVKGDVPDLPRAACFPPSPEPPVSTPWVLSRKDGAWELNLGFGLKCDLAFIAH